MRGKRFGFLGGIPMTAALAVLSVTMAGARPQEPQDAVRSESESGVTLSAEVFCSEAKLRTPSVRLRWSLSSSARSRAQLTALADATQTLDTTVYAGGFDKGLYVTFPVPGSAPPNPIAAVAPPSAQVREMTLRAYQIQLVEVEPDDAPRPAAEAEEPAAEGEQVVPFTVVVENLEPGMNYTWRVTIESGDTRLVSEPVTVQAPTCPADMVTPPRPRR